jgi:glutaminyl-tRNA synthetase
MLTSRIINQLLSKARGSRAKDKVIDEIKRISKKYTNLSGDKLQAARASIMNLAESVSYEELEPLFNTAAKKQARV